MMGRMVVAAAAHPRRRLKALAILLAEQFKSESASNQRVEPTKQNTDFQLDAHTVAAHTQGRYA
jgi:hypothetical protein